MPKKIVKQTRIFLLANDSKGQNVIAIASQQDLDDAIDYYGRFDRSEQLGLMEQIKQVMRDIDIMKCTPEQEKNYFTDVLLFNALRFVLDGTPVSKASVITPDLVDKMMA